MRLVLVACLLLTVPAVAAELVLPVDRCADDRREDAAPPCVVDPDFTAGGSSAAGQLQIGGTAYGCDAEWAASVEFDLTVLPADLEIESAVLTVRKTGHADDAAGLFYLALFSYTATGTPVSVPRDDLDPDTALSISMAPTANVSLDYDVTTDLRAQIDHGAERAGWLLAGVYSEAGYEDWITVAGFGHAAAPVLTVTYAGAVGAGTTGWSELKNDFR